MAGIFGVFRNVVFLGWLSVALVSTTIAAGIWALQMTTTVAAMSAKAASTAVAHRKQLAKAVAKAKARLRRAVVAVPIAGVAAIGYFEEQDYQEWLEDHPEGTRQQYACEVASMTAEIADEVLQNLPERVRPGPETILGYMPECE